MSVLTTAEPAAAPGVLDRLFDQLATAPRLRGPLLGHLAGSLALTSALAWRSRDLTASALASLGVPDPRTAVVAVAALVVLLGSALLLAALALGAVLLHVGARIAGADRPFPVSASTYLVATTPVWVRNVGLALALLLGLDPARLSSLALGDPFLLLAAWLAVVGLRRVHRLTTGRALVVATVTVLGGVLAGLASGVVS